MLMYLIVLIHKKVTKLDFKVRKIPEFSIDVHYEPFPNTVNIENKYDCNAESLHKCDINDSTTLFGCKELIVRCHHFSDDTTYFNNGTEKVIPKNDHENEGYALAITTIAKACNPYHGDLTLVTKDDTTKEYMLICTCINPGLIGNDHILGNCTTVYMCNGKIDNINKPIQKIWCECTDREQEWRYQNGPPVCKTLLVRNANDRYDDWTHLVPFNSSRQLDVKMFDVTIAGNLKVKRLLDPCQSSVHDTTIAIPNARFDNISGRCLVLDYGIPLSTGMLNFHPPENSRETSLDVDDSAAPNPAEDVKSLVSSDCVLATGKYNRLRFSDNIAGVRRITSISVNGLPFADSLKDKDVVVVPSAGMTVGQNAQININAINDVFFSPKCSGVWPRYNCYISQYFDHKQQNLTFPGFRECPTAFLWGRELWDSCEFLVHKGVRSNPYGLYFNNEHFKKVPNIKPYGIQWSSNTAKNDTGLLSFVNRSDYDKHKAILT